VDLEHLGLARQLDPKVLQQRHKTLTERLELLSRVPDLADSEVAVRTEGDVVLKSLRQPVAGLLRRRMLSSYCSVVTLGAAVKRTRMLVERSSLLGVTGSGIPKLAAGVHSGELPVLDPGPGTLSRN
jgi:hypothetical protein